MSTDYGEHTALYILNNRVGGVGGGGQGRRKTDGQKSEIPRCRADVKNVFGVFIYIFLYSFIHAFIHSFIHSFIPSFSHSFIRSVIYLFIEG